MKKKFKLTKEEQELENSLDSDQWEEASPKLIDEVSRAAQFGIEKRRREARVNIRLNQGDVDLIRQRATEEGLGYQTLMSSVLHKFATGRLVERKIINEIASEIAAKVRKGQSRKKAAG